jgi:hypothetical protein
VEVKAGEKVVVKRVYQTAIRSFSPLNSKYDLSLLKRVLLVPPPILQCIFPPYY